MPSKWYIDFGEPIATHDLGPQTVDNVFTVSQISDDVRNRVQEMINNRLAQRPSAFFG